ncbi:guanine nucleotide-binding protein-like 1 [Plakobranchus ocellatus]|uniref:Guanine nucleotide-binding protein-like 1 n=1 Tax=Plakobranchus ocellatus TaxID=259542 RepID=A0AAV3Y323_9GAST|nr:guanine nucleotide-binding protein-like 1 [Plakobranchus ocellatus]
MPRKTPYSGKQKKKQLQEKKLKKQSGPGYLRDSEDESEESKSSSSALPSEQQTESYGNRNKSGAGNDRGTKGIPEVQKLNLQPHQKDTRKLDANSFRLHFFKEDPEVISRRMKEARKPVKPVTEESREWMLEDAYPSNAKLDFPKRPPWSYSSSKEELDKREQQYFKEYVEDILDQPRTQDLSFFELNLETWRQLWRVLEMSDILLVIADVRYPVLHVPPRLLNYVMDDLKKQTIIILNKVDLVSPSLALAWKRYLETKFPGVHVVFFSSNPREVLLDNGLDPSTVLQKRPFHRKTLPVGPEDLCETVKSVTKGTVDLSSWEQRVKEESPLTENVECCIQNPDTDVEGQHSTTEETASHSMLTIGCIGYPNAGKSSVLNALVGKKVVSVSKSPGHTKHFQTIFLTPTVRLCDCPGLVFPSMVPKSLQVVAGIFPVSQVREPYSVVGYLAKRLDLPKLLHIQPSSSSSSGGSSGPQNKHQGANDGWQWSAYDICEAWAMKCGYTTSKAGRPDMYRAANKILRLAVEGQLCLCFYPPGFSKNKETVTNDPECTDLAKTLSGKTRHGATHAEGNAMLGWAGGELEEEGEEESDSDGSNQEELQVYTMFDKLCVQDGRGGVTSEDET